MALFCAAIRRHSVSSDFPFLLFSCEILPVCHLKYPCSCFSSYFCFLVIVILLIIVLFMLFLVAIINLTMLFFMYSLSPCIDVSTLFSMLVSPLPPFFLDTYSLSMSSLRCKVLCIVISSLILWFICWMFFPRPFQEWSQVSYKGDSPGVYSFDEISAIVFGFKIFFLIWRKKFLKPNSFLIFFISTSLMVSASNISQYL